MKKHLTERGEHNPYGMLKPQLPRQVPDRPHQSAERKTQKVGEGVLWPLPCDRRTYVCRNNALHSLPYVLRRSTGTQKQCNTLSKERSEARLSRNRSSRDIRPVLTLPRFVSDNQLLKAKRKTPQHQVSNLRSLRSRIKQPSPASE